jgi:hypothetical protein
MALLPNKTTASATELTKTRQFGQNYWHVYKRSSSSVTAAKIGHITYTPPAAVTSWSVFSRNPYIFTVPNNPYSNGDVITFPTGTLPSNLHHGTKYVVMNVSGNDFNIGPITGGGPL